MLPVQVYQLMSTVSCLICCRPSPAGSLLQGVSAPAKMQTNHSSASMWAAPAHSTTAAPSETTSLWSTAGRGGPQGAMFGPCLTCLHRRPQTIFCCMVKAHIVVRSRKEGTTWLALYLCPKLGQLNKKWSMKQLRMWTICRHRNNYATVLCADFVPTVRKTTWNLLCYSSDESLLIDEWKMKVTFYL